MDPPSSLSKDELQEVEKIISYRFENLALLREALRDPGYCNDDGNGVLALLGDKALGLMIGLQGHKSGDDLEEIDYDILNRTSDGIFPELAIDSGLSRYICTSQPSMSSDILMWITLKAIAGAVFLDSNRDLAVLESVMDKLESYPTS